MIEVKRFHPDLASIWNEFVLTAKNSTFLFHRNYLSYHEDRFSDHSVLLYKKGKIIAVLPANEVDNKITSHAGLTYGGLVLQKDAKLEEVLSGFYHALNYYSSLGYTELIYKCFPPFLAEFTAQEDLYALYLLQAELFRRDSGCVLPLGQSLPVQTRRYRSAKKATALNVQCVQSLDPTFYIEKILAPTLWQRYKALPVHTVAEMKLLMERFPENIRLFEATLDEPIAGTIIYETPTVAHAQYIAATEKGKDVGALDLLFIHLLQDQYRHKKFFSFGISNENDGRYLNRGLLSWKEGFGARTVAIDFYRIQMENFRMLEAYAD